MFKYIATALLSLAILAPAAFANGKPVPMVDRLWDACLGTAEPHEDFPGYMAEHSGTYRGAVNICKTQARYCKAKWNNIRRCGRNYLKTLENINVELCRSHGADHDVHPTPHHRSYRSTWLRQCIGDSRRSSQDDLGMWKEEVAFGKSYCEEVKEECISNID